MVKYVAGNISIEIMRTILSYYDIHIGNQVGSNGEYAVHYLHDRKEEIGVEQVRHPSESSIYLQTQVEKWLSEITPGTKVEFENYEHANAIGMMMKGSAFERDIPRYYSAYNVGFGITYVLPVVLALLKAKKGALVLIENPEVHLHPKGQRKMRELISRAASGGVFDEWDKAIDDLF